MSKKQIKTILLLIALFLGLFQTTFAKKSDELQQLKEDVATVWPLAQIIKIEYELVNAQLEFYKTEKEKKAFLCEYEEFIKDKYYDALISLKFRQSKLLLLLIDRELGKTPFELIRVNRSYKRANFWQHCAEVIGASLKEKYTPEKYPLIEHEVQLMKSTSSIPLMLLEKDR